MFCWWKATWLKFYEFLPGPRIWPVKLASGVDEKTEVGFVPHQVGVADVVLDQTPTQDDHPCKGSKISLGKVTFLVMLLNGKEVPYAWTTLRICLYLCWHFSLQACWSVSSPQGCQRPSLNNVCWIVSMTSRGTPNYMSKHLDVWRSERRAYLQDFHPSEREKSQGCRSCNGKTGDSQSAVWNQTFYGTHFAAQ